MANVDKNYVRTLTANMNRIEGQERAQTGEIAAEHGSPYVEYLAKKPVEENNNVTPDRSKLWPADSQSPNNGADERRGLPRAGVNSQTIGAGLT